MSKMVPFDVVTSCFNVISNSRRVIVFQKGFEMFRFPIVESSLRFSNVKNFAVPATRPPLIQCIYSFPKISTVILLKMYVD